MQQLITFNMSAAFIKGRGAVLRSFDSQFVLTSALVLSNLGAVQCRQVTCVGLMHSQWLVSRTNVAVLLEIQRKMTQETANWCLLFRLSMFICTTFEVSLGHFSPTEV